MAKAFTQRWVLRCWRRKSVLPYGVEPSTEDVDARTRTLRNIRFLLLTRSFKLETSEWSLEPTKTLSTSGGSISSLQGIHRQSKA